MTESQHHITGKSIVLVTSQNKVYKLEYGLFSARRPHPPKPAPTPTSFKEAFNQAAEQAREDEKEVLVVKSDKFPMYDPVIPQLNTKFVTYDLQLTNLERIQTFSSRLESTTQVFAYGHDLFLARVKPDGSFDMLDEEFNFTLLFGFIVLILLGNWYVARMQKKEQTKTQFLTL
jgi:hypothetical protein